MSSYAAGSIKSSGEKTSQIFKGLLLLNPTKILSQTLRGICENSPYRHLMESDSVVEDEYRNVYLVEWCE